MGSFEIIESDLQKLDFLKVLEKVKSYLCFPEHFGGISFDFLKAQASFKELEEFISRFIFIPDLSGVPDIEFLFSGRVLTEDQAFKIGRFLEEVRKWKEALPDWHFRPLDDLRSYIESVFDKKGKLRDDATPALARLNRERSDLKVKLEQILGKFLKRSPELFTENVLVYKFGRILLPLKHGIELGGVVHGISDSGFTLYWEPDSTVLLNNRYFELDESIKREKEKILIEITNRCHSHLKALKENWKLFLKIDWLIARWKFKEKFKACIPNFSQKPEIKLKGARHPLIQRPVPVDLLVGDGYRGLVITGPNMGGKTVALKTLGLFLCLAYAGIPVPAEQAVVGRFNSLYVDIGDEQSVEGRLSTFASHLKNIKRALESASESSLVLIDELGTGTDPQEGAAIAVAIMEELLNKKCVFVVTTHIEAVKMFAISKKEVEVAAVTFDELNLSPLFKLQYGTVGESCALRVAEMLEFPPHVLQKARSRLSFDSTHGIIAEIQRRRDRLLKLEKKMQSMIKKYRAVFERLLSEIKQEKESKKKREEFLKVLEEAEQSFLPKKSVSFSVGDWVSFKGKTGQIIELKGKKATVAFSGMRAVLPVDSLLKASPPVFEPLKIEVERVDELYLKGLRVEEALAELEKAINRAFTLGKKNFTVVHGTGTGSLQRAVHAHLKRHPLVSRFESYPGRTVVYLLDSGNKNL